MPLHRCSSVVLIAALFAGCDSKIESTTDQALLDKVQTITDCFPGLYGKVDALLALADTWRMNSASAVADPSGLTYSQGGSGEVNATFVFNGCTLTMTIRFYSPAGVEQNLNLSAGSSLAEKIDLAATQLRNASPTGSPFMVGDWTLTGTKGGDPVNGSGALTGIIGGSTNGNELEELRTTTATPAGGPPPGAASSITEGACSLTFSTSGLVTDGSPTQQYPIGALDITLAGTLATVEATVTFDDTPVIEVTIDGVPGRFEYDVENDTLTQVP